MVLILLALNQLFLELLHMRPSSPKKYFKRKPFEIVEMGCLQARYFAVI